MSISKPTSRIRLFLGGLWPRVPILHRYLAKELLFVTVLTTILITSLMAFCGLLKPLAQHGITGPEMLEILILLFPFFLVFTVPFAVMLACTWVYGRLSADNELNACSTSGINVQTLLIVPVVLGLLAMAMNLGLTYWLVPNWALRRFDILIAKHGKDIVYRQLSRKGSFTLRPHQIGFTCIIHADSVDPVNNILHGIGVAVYGKNSNKIKQIITAEKAELRFVASGENGDVLDSIEVEPIQPTVVNLPRLSSYRAANLIFRGKIRQKIRQRLSAMSLDDLLALRKDPERHNSIGHPAQEARRIFIASELVKKLKAERDKRGYFELWGPQARFHFRGEPSEPVFKDDGASKLLVNATIEEYIPGATKPVRIFANVSQLDLELVEVSADTYASDKKNNPPGLTASMVMRNVHITTPGGPDDEQVLEQSHFTIDRLAIPEDILQRGMELSLERIKQGDFPLPTPSKLLQLGPHINTRLAELYKKITLEIHSRFATAVCCPVLAVLGALLGAIFRKGQFLVAAGLSVIPAMVALLFIAMGQRMADSDAFSTGMAVGVAWTGLILLSAANVVLTVKVLRK